MNEETLDRENDILLAEIKDKAKELSKYFDSVQIFCSKFESPEIGTTKFNYGYGNFWARYGQVINWIKEEDSERQD